MLLVLGITFLQRCSLFLLTGLVYLGFSQQGTSLLTVMLLQASVSVAVDMLPLPGAQGITEAMYASVFGGIFPGGYLVASMCITRGASFYAVMVIGLITFCRVNFTEIKRVRE